jgi:cereblon
MLRQMAELPRMEAMVRTPSLLSYYIASNMPLQDATRQELLEVDGTVYRLRREIELLESMDQLRCKRCLDIKARRSDMLVMSADGPISVFVNTHGYVHDTLTLQRASGLVVSGQPQTANSWFPGYAWVLAECSACTEHMGWRFTAVSKETRPKAFWGIRRSQLADNSS